MDNLLTILYTMSKIMGKYNLTHNELIYLFQVAFNTNRFSLNPTSSYMASKLNLSIQLASQTTKGLVAKGYLEQVPGEVDRRTKELVLTSKGISIIEFAGFKVKQNGKKKMD